MDPRERRERLKELFGEVSSLSPEGRNEALERIRSEDPELEAEIRALLSQPTRPEFMGANAAGALAAATLHIAPDPPEPAQQPKQLGPYRLTGLIGSGGMGVVYRAEQSHPIRREVAVKVLRGGLSPEKLIARFEAERRALALIDHPGVARILDAGSDEAGTAYIVMELVRGAPITDFVRDGRLTVRDALPLFISACRAVQHAHQKGVIHRDLKPANILVTAVDGAATAKVIDFGIARIVDDGDSGVSLTGAGQVLGTLEYMSPEQASGRSRDVDTRSDVYSLGAVLYQLVTGTLPHDLRDKSYAEAIETIRRNPPRPFRQTRGGAKPPDSDLETITRKALELDPARRYDGPGALADDLERYLRMEPIVARPPSAAYQVRKLVQRHRPAVAAGAAIVLLLVVFGVSMSILYAQQRRERERAEREAGKAEAANRFLRDMIGAATPNRLGRDVTIRRAMDQSLAELSHGYGLNPEVLAVVQHAMGTAYLELGEPVRADSLIRCALDLQVKLHGEHDPETTETLLSLAATAAKRRRDVEADSLAECAIRLVPPGSPHAQERLAVAYRIRGEIRTYTSPAQGESLMQLAVVHARRAYGPDSPEFAESQALLGWAKAQKGDVQEGLALIRSAARSLEKVLGPSHSKTVAALSSLAQISPHDESIRIKRRLLDLSLRTFGPDHPSTGDVQNDLAVSYMVAQSYTEAESLELAAIGTWTRAYGPIHENIAVGYNNLAYIKHCQGDLDSAAAGFLRAADIIGRTEGPNGTMSQVFRRNLAGVRIDQGRHDEALAILRRAHESFARGTTLAAEGKDAVEVMGTLATAHWVADHADSAAAWARRSLSAYSRMKLEDDPNVPVLRCVLALSLYAGGDHAGADAVLPAEGHRVVEGAAWPTDKRRLLLALERHYSSRGNQAEAAYYRNAREAMPQ